MAWRFIKSEKVRRIIFVISIFLGVIAGLYSWNETKQSAIQHYQQQEVIVYDMNVLLNNQKIIVGNQKVFMKNGTLSDIRDIQSDIAEDYNDLLYSKQTINPSTGQ